MNHHMILINPDSALCRKSVYLAESPRMFDQLSHHPDWHHFQKSLVLEKNWMSPLSDYMGQNPGKQLRPRLVFLTAFLMECPLPQAREWAQLIEYIHWASLFHDDIIDQSVLRRGKPSVHRRFGYSQAILGGDFLVNHVFGRLIRWSRLDLMSYVHEALDQLLQGQIEEEALTLAATFEDYQHVALQKTSALFILSVQGICALTQAPCTSKKALEAYARNIGLAFQMQDDVYDYFPPQNPQWGKDKGQDFDQKKISLPLLHLYQECSETEKKALKHYISKKDFERTQSLLQKHHIYEKCQEQIKYYIQKAISDLAHAFSTQKIKDFGFLDFAQYCQTRQS